MLAFLVLDAIYLGLVWGAAGELVATVAAWSGFGGAVGATAGLVVKLHVRRRPPPSPWMPRPTVDLGLYATAGACLGAAIGGTLVILYLLGVVS